MIRKSWVGDDDAARGSDEVEALRFGGRVRTFFGASPKLLAVAGLSFGFQGAGAETTPNRADSGRADNRQGSGVLRGTSTKLHKIYRPELASLYMHDRYRYDPPTFPGISSEAPFPPKPTSSITCLAIPDP